MKTEIHSCDGDCGRETRDFYAESGWLVFTIASTSSAFLTRGRDDRGQAKTHWKPLAAGTTYLFCSPRCLRAFLERA